MENLISEQYPNDGGWHVKRLVDEANARLSQIGRKGKRAKIVLKKTSLSLQFSFKDGNSNPQKNPGLGGLLLSPKGIQEAERIAELVTGQLVAGTFAWDWYNSLIGKDTTASSKVPACKEMLEEYKKYYFKQRKDNKTVEGSWYKECRQMEKVFANSDKPLSLPLIRQAVDLTENNSSVRTCCLNGLVSFLKYFVNDDYKAVIKQYKAGNKPKSKKRNVPNQRRIAEVYKDGFTPHLRCPKTILHRYPQWQFLYGLLATYGLRIHEAWNIANWDSPVTLRNGDWVTIETGEDSDIAVQRQAGDMMIPAILDPKNSEHILCVKHDTKTGYRMVMPISPEGHNWVEEFNLIQPFNLPDIKNPLERENSGKSCFSCSNKTGKWFSSHKYGFTPHDLRHAYNHRGHLLGYNPKTLADSLGHSMKMNSDVYLRSQSDLVKLEGLTTAITKEQNKRSELEVLKDKYKTLKTRITSLENENELLRTKLKMYEAIESNARIDADNKLL
jgi:integrase